MAMIWVLLYLLGSAVAFWYVTDYYNNTNEDAIEDPSACIVYMAATLLSWVFVIIYLVNRYDSKLK